MRVRIQHTTRYTYEAPVGLGPHTLRLCPAPHLASRVLTYNLDVSPKAKIHWQLDAWANRIARVTFPADDDVRELRVQVDASFDLQPMNPFDFYVDDRCERVPFTYPDGYALELRPFLRTDDLDPAVVAWAKTIPSGQYVVDFLTDLVRRVAEQTRYLIRLEPGLQTPSETLTKASGSCRDSAWLLVHALRAHGLAARFVSGYLIQLEDEGNIPGVPRGMTKDVLDLHAWAEAYIPGAGWIGLDGTSGLLCTEGHIPLAATTSPDLAAAITGTASRAADGFEFHMEVSRLGHEPRPRKPYTDEQYDALLASADAVDARIAAHGVVLTTGGEPTWTSREHPDKPEWQTGAVGPTKLGQGLRLAAELRTRLAPGGVVLQRAGKHYPGESLPRWALHLLWRRDGLPIWRDPSLLDLPEDARTGATLAEAERFSRGLHKALGLDLEPMPAYEDAWVAVRTEAMLPTDVDPTELDLDDPEERQRLARVLERGVHTPVGFVTPVQPQQIQWLTQAWTFRRGRLTLLPGDSPIGLRLPLDRLAGPALETWPADGWGSDRPLPAEPRVVHQTPSTALPAPGAEAPHIRTALCVEPRDGVLHVFLPPLPTTESFLEVLAHIEDVARAQKIRVRLEGYGPPHDPRLGECLVTPDPGVLEVNLPWQTSTRGYADLLAVVDDAANHSGLCTERFQLDGRSVGSGGGNHITLGGPSPEQSVFLAQPHVLASLVRYFQHHPSLSYFFTGLFVGPSSQAPRVDEARDGLLDELELALSKLGRGGDAPPFWFIDRLLRNLMVDVTGNTHRAEISIDKLFTPYGGAGRLGIVELRAFEMPPNARMATAQVFLMRALIARFLDAPFTAPLVHWGKRLHDRFLLPHFLWSDLRDVLADLGAHGVQIDTAWFEPFLEYRFPLMGRLITDGVELTLRPALEPWHTLGEEPTGATVSRFVDSSLERIEVTVRGIDPTRHAIGVNGVRLPLVATDDPEVAVAGIRFRAWQPPHCLHPHLGIHHPLRLDVVDTWGRRSLGSATWHVWHPEGRAFDEPPFTAVEAASRRSSRVTYHAHQPFPVDLREPPRMGARGVTLDLRWTDDDVQLPTVAED